MAKSKKPNSSARSKSATPAFKPAVETPLSESATGAASAAPGVGKELTILMKSLGYETVEEVVGVLRVGHREVAKEFGFDQGDVQTFAVAIRGMAAAAATDQEKKFIAAGHYKLGVAIDRIPRDLEVPSVPSVALAASAPPPAVANLPATVNMVDQMPGIRDQDQRGTCVAHAALAAYEHHLRQLEHKHDLSEQFLYWACKQNDGSPQSEGTWLRVAFDRLYQEGVCPEASWPYVPTPVVGNEGQDPPPPGAVLDALDFQIGDYLRLGPRAVDDIKQVLASGRCVAFSVPVYKTLMKNEEAFKTGRIPPPLPGEFPVGGHAMCFVGYVDGTGIAGGRFIIRNSWGDRFGFASPYGPGYGTIPYAYISRLGMEAFALK